MPLRNMMDQPRRRDHHAPLAILLFATRRGAKPRDVFDVSDIGDAYAR